MSPSTFRIAIILATVLWLAIGCGVAVVIALVRAGAQ